MQSGWADEAAEVAEAAKANTASAAKTTVANDLNFLVMGAPREIGQDCACR